MRILHVSQPVDGGCGSCVASLALDQVRRGFDVHVATGPHGPLPRRAAQGAAVVHPWPSDRQPGPGTIAELVRLRTILRSVRPDVVHLHSSKAGLAGRLLIRGSIPTLFQPHGWSFAATSGAQAVLASVWERQAARWCTHLVCVSEGERLDGQRAGVAGPWMVIENGVDTERFRPPTSAERASARDRFGGDGPVVVCVGRLVAAKGHDVLLDGWPAVRRAVPDARLVLAGDGPHRSTLEAVDTPGVTLLGDVADVLPVLWAADVVVFPTRTEALSLALLEAMAAGRSIVATDVGGTRSALAGGCGGVVAPGSAAALAAAIVERLADPALRATEGELARVRAEERFSEGRWLDEMADLAVRAAGSR